MARVSIFVIVVALIGGIMGCAPGPTTQYDLTISTTEGGQVTSPGEGTFTYDEGEKVSLAAKPDEGYQFASWTGDVGTVANVNTASTTITLNGDYSITANFAVKQYSLVIHSTEGGSVAAPGESAYTYDKGEVVNLVAVADESYVFTNWTGDTGTVADVNAASTSITMDGGYSIAANFAKGIWDWYDLDAVRDNLDGSYVLMNDLDSSTAGYDELASETANGGKGWEPIGSLFVGPSSFSIVDAVPFTGVFNGQGYEIGDLFVNRPDEDGVGLFSFVAGGGVIENLGVTNSEVTGHIYIGGLVAHNGGAVSNCYSTANVIGYSQYTGGLVGGNGGTVSSSYSRGSVTGDGPVGGLAGGNWGTVRDSYSTGSVTGGWTVGGLVGWQHHGTLSNSYCTGSVTGEGSVGGLVAQNHGGTVSNSYFSYDEVLINGRNMITIGALPNEDFEEWLANDKFLDVNERLSQEDGYYLINDVNEFRSLLAFGQNIALKFRLTNDLDLGSDPDLYIPYLAGEFDGNGRRISNLRLDLESVAQVGLFGYLASGAAVTEVSVWDVNMNGYGIVGGLVGENDGGTLSNSYVTGRVAGHWSTGGLVGWIGYNGGSVSNCYYNYDEFFINDRHAITIGALFNEDFGQWLANDKFLDVNERLSQEDGYYLINDVNDLKSLLAFGQDGALEFRLTDDLDLSDEPNFYIPYLAGEFDGSGHRISNLTLDFSGVAQVGLFGYVASGGDISQVGVENLSVTVTGDREIGGLVGGSEGTVSNSYCTGSVAGGSELGGLVGWNRGTVSNCYSAGKVAGYGFVGGLVGWNDRGTVSNSYSTNSVTGETVGGLVAQGGGSVTSSFWNTQTSGQSTSDGGTGKTTAEMKNITTFSGAGWNITAVAPGEPNASYIWNIVDGQTYPFLSWEP